MSESPPNPQIADIAFDTAVASVGLVLFTVSCRDLEIRAVMQPSKAAELAELLYTQAQRAAALIQSN